LFIGDLFPELGKDYVCFTGTTNLTAYRNTGVASYGTQTGASVSIPPIGNGLLLLTSTQFRRRGRLICHSSVCSRDSYQRRSL